MDYLNPKSVAIVGVSVEENKIGTVVLRNLKSGGFLGNIYPVNPKYEDIHGYKCFPKLSSIPEAVELAVIAIPAAFVVDAVRDGAEKGVQTFVIISAGFGESGAEGKAREEELSALVKDKGIRIIGPNCLGYINTVSKVNVSFAASQPPKGKVAFISQSGAFNTAILDMALVQSLGFSYFVSLGNKIDVNEMDLIQTWEADPEVAVIGLYIEEFADGRELIQAVSQISKPVVLLHPGESKAAQAAIASHTGSLAGGSKLVDAACAQSGMIRVHNIDQMFATLQIFAQKTPLTLGKTTVLTNAGGPGIIATDTLASAGIELATLSEGTQGELAKVLPEAASKHNPVDALGDADAERYKAALEILTKAPEVDSIVLLLTPQYMTEITDTATMLAGIIPGSSKLIIPVFIGGQEVKAGLQQLWKAGIPAFISLQAAVQALGNLATYQRALRQNNWQVEQVAAQYTDEIDRLLTTDQPVTLPADLSQKLAVEAGITLPKELLTDQVDAALAFADQIGYPVVIKANAEAIIHKTEQNAVRVGIANVDQLRTEMAELQVLLASQNLATQILVQQQIQNATEIFIGASRDGAANVYEASGLGFGHMILLGGGGIYTELYQDLAYLLAPADRERFSAAINSTKVGEIIEGMRGKAPLKKDALLDMLLAVQKLVTTYPQIVSLDLNPILLTTEGCWAADLKLFIQK